MIILNQEIDNISGQGIIISQRSQKDLDWAKDVINKYFDERFVRNILFIKGIPDTETAAMIRKMNANVIFGSLFYDNGKNFSDLILQLDDPQYNFSNIGAWKMLCLTSMPENVVKTSYNWRHKFAHMDAKNMYYFERNEEFLIKLISSAILRADIVYRGIIEGIADLKIPNIDNEIYERHQDGGFYSLPMR